MRGSEGKLEPDGTEEYSDTARDQIGQSEFETSSYAYKMGQIPGRSTHTSPLTTTTTSLKQNSASCHHRRRFWCWRFWFLSTISTLIISHIKIGDGASGSSIAGAMLSLNITRISSPLSMEALTGVSSDQCKPWTVDGGSGPSLTWSYESRMLLVSISNVYEIYDTTSVSSYYVDLQYAPNSLSVKNAEIEDADGLGFHLAFNATPLCGSTRLPTKILCNDGMVVPINKTTLLNADGPNGAVTQSLCGGRYFVSYRYTYSCSNLRFSPPSCKTSCRPTNNSTHCYTCDDQDGERRCCPGSTESECTIATTGAAILSQTASQETFTVEGTALIIIIVLSVTCTLLLVSCLLCSALLSVERKRNRQRAAKSRANGWMQNGSVSVQHHPQKNGTCIRVNGNVAYSVAKANGNGVHHHSSPSVSDNRSCDPPYAAVTHLPSLASVSAAEQRRPASCDPSAVDSTRRWKLDADDLHRSTDRNGRFAAPRARAPLDMIFATHQKKTPQSKPSAPSNSSDAGCTRRRDLGTLF